MKVKELIEALSALDPELMVVRPGYEGGVTEVGYVTQVQLALNVNEDWYYGEHEVVGEEGYRHFTDAQQASAVELT